MPQQQAKPQFSDLWFPLNGSDVSVALEQQIPDTTPLGLNVRAFEPQTMRARGGSRQGLSQYIPQALPLSYASGSRAIQMLQVVVDPQAIALGISFDDTPDPGPEFDDPSNRGRNILGDGRVGSIRRHGSGFHSNKKYKRKAHKRLTPASAPATAVVNVEPIDPFCTGILGSVAMSFNGQSHPYAGFDGNIADDSQSLGPLAWYLPIGDFFSFGGNTLELVNSGSTGICSFNVFVAYTAGGILQTSPSQVWGPNGTVTIEF